MPTYEVSVSEKRCTRCDIIKPAAEFSRNKAASTGLEYKCKACAKICFRAYYEKDHERLLARKAEYDASNRDKIRKYYTSAPALALAAKRKRRYREDKEFRAKEALAKKQYRSTPGGRLQGLLQQRAWQKANREKFLTRARAYYRKRRREDEVFNLVSRIRSRLSTALKTAGVKKTQRSLEYVGCSQAQLVDWIEFQFCDRMTWDDRSTWHVDHILPVAMFDMTDPDQQLICFHWTNLQPLWAKDNHHKSGTFMQCHWQNSRAVVAKFLEVYHTDGTENRVLEMNDDFVQRYISSV